MASLMDVRRRICAAGFLAQPARRSQGRACRLRVYWSVKKARLLRISPGEMRRVEATRTECNRPSMLFRQKSRNRRRVGNFTGPKNAGDQLIELRGVGHTIRIGSKTHVVRPLRISQGLAQDH